MNKHLCNTCIHRGKEWHDGGYCYMFKKEPSGIFCGVYQEIKEKIIHENLKK